MKCSLHIGSLSSTNTYSMSSSSSRRCSLSSSQRTLRAIQTEIIQRNLVTDFLEATSLPVNVPIHRWRQADSPGSPALVTLASWQKELPPCLARRLSLQSCSTSCGSREEQELLFFLEL